MTVDKAMSIGSAIVAVAMVTTIVAHPGTAGVINAIGGAFSSSLKAAMGN